MNTKSVLSACGISLLIGVTAQGVMARAVLPGEGPARPPQTAQSPSPAVFFAQTLNTGISADVFRVTCFARCMSADVFDVGNFKDTNFQVSVIGSSGGIAGRTDASISPKGGLAQVAQICNYPVVNESLRGYVTYTEVNAPGIETYNSIVSCKNAAGGIVNPVVVQILNQ